MRVILKRKFTEVEKNPYCSSSSLSPSSLSSSSEWETDEDACSSEKNDFTPHSPASPDALPVRSILKRNKIDKERANVRFDNVAVFSFPRCQGFTSVPSRGGATLGMARKHGALRTFTVAEHVLEQRHRRRERRREKLREAKFEAFKRKLVISGAVDQREADRLSVEEILPEDIHVSDAELESGGFLQPFSSKQRQAILQAAGVKAIDREEKRQLHALRLSREDCGCDCQGFCEPETCACSLAGIKCQVDRFNFPCGCSKDSCGNTYGRIEFDARRVRTHYIHTVMKLEMEGRQRDEAARSEGQVGLSAELRRREDPDEIHPVQSAQNKRCPFGFNSEEEGLPLTMPATPSFHFLPERVAVEENSCSSDMTESSCSSSDSAGSQSPGEADGALDSALTLCDPANSALCGQLRHIQPLLQHSSSATDTVGPHADNLSRTFLDENANQSRDLFDEDSLEDFPNTPSPTVDYSLGRYMDLSLSSDSDLEFFDSDYPSGSSCCSFKQHQHPCSLQPIQIFNSVNLPHYESSTHLLESLIGLT